MFSSNGLWSLHIRKIILSHLTPTALNRIPQGLELNHQHRQKSRLGSDHMLGDLKLGLIQLLPQLFTMILPKMVLALGKAVPLSSGQLGQSLRSRIFLEKIQRYIRFQIRKYLQRPHIVLFEGSTQLIEQSSFLPHQPVLIPSEQFKFLSRIGVGLKRSQMTVIRPHKLRQYVSVEGVALGLAHAKPVPGSIQRLGVHRIDHHPVVQKKINYPSVRLLYSCPKLDSLCPILIEPAAKLSQSLDILDDLLLDDFVAFRITDPHLMKLIGPIHSQIVSLQLLCLLGLVLPISVAPNGMFALYRSSTKGPLSMEPLIRSLVGQDSLPLILKMEWDEGGPHAGKLLKSVSHIHDLQHQSLQHSQYKDEGGGLNVLNGWNVWNCSALRRSHDLAKVLN